MQFKSPLKQRNRVTPCESAQARIRTECLDSKDLHLRRLVSRHLLFVSFFMLNNSKEQKGKELEGKKGIRGKERN